MILLSSYQLEWLNKILEFLPPTKKFTIHGLLSMVEPFNDKSEIQNANELSEILTNYLLENKFADDMSNPFIYKYVEGQELNVYCIRLTNEGIKLKESGSYTNYENALKTETRIRKYDKIKSNLNLFFTIVAAIAAIISIIISLFK